MKTCPFCDSSDLFMGHLSKDKEGYPVYVCCDNCGCCGPVTWVATVPESLTEELINATGWNRRPQEKALLIEKACRALDDLIDSFEEFKSIGLSIDDYKRFHNPSSMKKLINLLKEKM